MIVKSLLVYIGKTKLWNPKDNAYNVKNDACLEVATLMNSEIDIVQSNINSLLVSYRREKAKVLKSISTGKGK